MVKKRSIDRFPSRANESEQFPTFSRWVRLILLNVATLMLLALVIYPLMSQLATWIRPALEGEELNDFVKRHIARWNRASDPSILRVGLCLAACLIVAYPVFALPDRLFRWVSNLRHPPSKTKVKKKRIT